ncbi:hypothetical protein GGP41_003471 [Bipolaris sorokiniana]|uniref:Uncharacterized protein n=1 Tax=Cochliobolus sativus TaxID=45130 RepID=A0A8H5ZG36_COCSA|nr:hypothetical protein GGP41_003471 [Bipolaris sorokiniana]
MPKANVDLKEQSMNDGRWHRGAKLLAACTCQTLAPASFPPSVPGFETRAKPRAHRFVRNLTSRQILETVAAWTAVELVGLRTQIASNAD